MEWTYYTLQTKRYIFGGLVAILLILMFLVPGLIAAMLHNSIQKSRHTQVFTYLTNGLVYSFFINFAIYSFLYIRDSNDVINLSFTDGSHLFRVEFVIKFMVLSLVMAILLPILAKIVYTIRDLVSLSIKKFTNNKNLSPILSLQNREENFITRAINFFINTDDEELHKIISFQNSASLRKGTLYIYSPIYNLKFENKIDTLVISNREDLVNHQFSSKDSILVISNDVDDLIQFEDNSRTLFFSNTENKDLHASKTVVLPLFDFKDDNQKVIENDLLQTLLSYILDNERYGDVTESNN